MSKKKNLEIYLISFAQIISMFFPKGKKNTPKNTTRPTTVVKD